MRKGRLGIYVTTQADRTDLGFILRPGWLQVFPLHWLRVYSIFLAGRYKSILVHSLHSCPSKLDYLTNSPLQASSFVPLVNTHTHTIFLTHLKSYSHPSSHLQLASKQGINPKLPSLSPSPLPYHYHQHHQNLSLGLPQALLLLYGHFFRTWSRHASCFWAALCGNVQQEFSL